MRIASTSPMRAAEMAARHRFRPQLWPTLVVLVGVAILLSLGTWQVRRLAWKEDLIAKAEAGLAAPPVPLPPEPLDYAALDFRRVSLTGRYRHAEALGFGFTARNGEPGGHLVTPLELLDGRTVLVDRGWLPLALLPPAIPSGLEPEGEVEIAGVARHHAEDRRGPFQPANDPAARRWYSWDIAGMARAIGRPLLPLVLIAEAPPDAGPLPHVEPAGLDYRNNHLGYAVTWYGLAGALVAVYVAFSRRKPDGHPS